MADRIFKLRGAASDLYKVLDPFSTPTRDNGEAVGDGAVEVLLEGPAGTGKTTAVVLCLVHMCETYPGLRVLMLRKFHKHLCESVLITLEDDVLAPGHPVLLNSTASRFHRNSYDFPNGSKLVPGGLDHIESYRSSAWDVIVFFEATEASKDDWLKLLRGARGTALPNHRRYMLADTNPDAPMHWLNERGSTMVRLRSVHRDNPRFFADDLTPNHDGRNYMATLDAMSGHVRSRLRDGKWVAAEGLIWPEYQPSIHNLPRHKLADLPILYPYVAGVDWGYRAAGVIQIWGFDAAGRMYRVHETYQTEKTPEWWIGRALRLKRQYEPQVWICDSEDQGRIASFRAAGLNAIDAQKDVAFGIAKVRDRLKVNPLDGQPRLYLVDGSLDELDPKLRAQGKPTCLEDEIPGYVYKQTKDGKPITEEPDPACADHASDVMRYVTQYADNVDIKSPSKPKYRPGTWGYAFHREEGEGNWKVVGA